MPFEITTMNKTTAPKIESPTKGLFCHAKNTQPFMKERYLLMLTIILAAIYVTMGICFGVMVMKKAGELYDRDDWTDPATWLYVIGAAIIAIILWPILLVWGVIAALTDSDK